MYDKKSNGKDTPIHNSTHLNCHVTFTHKPFGNQGRFGKMGIKYAYNNVNNYISPSVLRSKHCKMTLSVKMCEHLLKKKKKLKLSSTFVNITIKTNDLYDTKQCMQHMHYISSLQVSNLILNFTHVNWSVEFTQIPNENQWAHLHAQWNSINYDKNKIKIIRTICTLFFALQVLKLILHISTTIKCSLTNQLKTNGVLASMTMCTWTIIRKLSKILKTQLYNKIMLITYKLHYNFLTLNSSMFV